MVNDRTNMKCKRLKLKMDIDCHLTVVKKYIALIHTLNVTKRKMENAQITEVKKQMVY